MILRAATPVVVFIVGLLFGRYRLGTTIRDYDDEGYFLLMIKHYLDGEHLYTEVFSQYGPFYTFAQKAMFRLLQLPVTHDAARQVTLIFWLSSAVLGGYFIYKLSKNVVSASAAGLASMLLARALADEPGHPQQIILPLMMLACCVCTSDAPINLLLFGAIGAALVFTKINVGIFYFAAVALTLVCRFPAGRIRTVGTGLLLFLRCDRARRSDASRCPRVGCQVLSYGDIVRCFYLPRCTADGTACPEASARRSLCEPRCGDSYDRYCHRNNVARHVRKHVVGSGRCLGAVATSWGCSMCAY